MPNWAPVGGNAGVAIIGHKQAAWSDVIRHCDTGTDAADQPRPGRRGPPAGTVANSLGSRAGLDAAGAVGNS